MSHAPLQRAEPTSVGALLHYWRKSRNLSQLALAVEAEVSSRHLSFLETGRAKPSREMVLHLAEVLSVPLRERNALLLSAGFAPLYRESSFDDPELGSVRAALDAILAQQEPYPAVVMNRGWDVVATNDAARRFFGFLSSGREPHGAGNVLRMMFHPDGLRPYVTNWESLARALVLRVHREAVEGVLHDESRRLLAEILDYPGVPAQWRAPDFDTVLTPVVPVCFRRGPDAFNFFSTVTVLGTPQDVTLQEMRIECFFPSDAETAARARRLAESSSA